MAEPEVSSVSEQSGAVFEKHESGLAFPGGQEAAGTHLPWAGSLPVSFRQLRGLLLSRAATAREAHLDPILCALTPLDLVVDMLK